MPESASRVKGAILPNLHPMTESMTRPSEGDQVRIFDHASGEFHEVLGIVAAIINRGIYGWIVELSDLRMIEVVAVPESRIFREVRPNERAGRSR